ncbi:MAG: NAD(P)H-binding protein [Ginsengibacter sp.]
MIDQKALVLGATGLIGSQVVEELLKDDSFSIVKVLSRRPLTIIHPKLLQEVVDFGNIDEYTEKFGEGDIIFCCIGTTQKNVKGDRLAYKKVDYDIPVNAAEIGISKNFKKFMIVSSVGADANSSNFYLQLKGKTENALKKFPFESIGIFQPSILLGNRAEVRSGEKVMQKLMKVFSKLLIGSFKKYRAVDSRDVAKAMVLESKQNNPGVHYLGYAEMMNLINA